MTIPVSTTDDEAWPKVEQALKQGATLKMITRARRAFADFGTGPIGTGISAPRVYQMERDGILQNIGLHRYGLAPSTEGIGTGLK